MSDLIGTWRKQVGEDCATPYPAELSILSGGQYRGSSPIPGGYTVWDVGTWSEQPGGIVEISTANDAVIRYRFRLGGGELRFQDPQGCTIKYARDAG